LRLFSFSSKVFDTNTPARSKNKIANKKNYLHAVFILEFQIDLPGIENYGFEGESSFMICKHGAVASDSEEASKVGRYFIDSHLFI
jgi:hypothetical protein